MFNRILGDDKPESFDFGRLAPSHGVVTDKIRYDPETHILLVGSNGVGKGTRLLLPNLLNMRGNISLCVVDVKGELAAVSAPYRRSLGQNVVVLNPFGTLTDKEGYHDLESAGFNPLAALDPRSREFDGQASELAEALIISDEKQPHWGDSARNLVAACIMFVVIKGYEHRRIPTMADVRRLLALPSAAPSRQNNFEGEGIPKLARKMARSILPGLQNKASQFTGWTEEIESIRSTALTQTAWLDEPAMQADMAKPGFDFREMKRRATTVYMVVPPDKLERFGRWLRIGMTVGLRASMRERAPGEPRVFFLMDEFSSLGRMKIIESVWAVVRGYGISMMPVVQDLNQLNNLYKDRWQTYVANSGAVAFFAPNEPFTADFVSRRLGETTRMMQSFSEAGGKYNINTSLVQVPVMTPTNLYGLEPGHLIFLKSGMSKFTRIYAPPYYRVKERAARARANPYVTPIPQRKDWLVSDNFSGGFWLPD